MKRMLTIMLAGTALALAARGGVQIVKDVDYLPAGRAEKAAGEIFFRCVSIADPAIGLAENLSRGAQLLAAAASKAAHDYLS